MSVPPPDEPVTVELDVETCIGAGNCELLQGDQFRIDDDSGVAELIGDGRLPAGEAELLVDRCPSGALTIRR